jgi:hypothetical protein
MRHGFASISSLLTALPRIVAAAIRLYRRDGLGTREALDRIAENWFTASRWRASTCTTIRQRSTRSNVRATTPTIPTGCGGCSTRSGRAAICLGSERGVATTVAGLWLASSYGGAGGFTGTMLTGMLAAQAAMKSRQPHGALFTTRT